MSDIRRSVWVIRCLAGPSGRDFTLPLLQSLERGDLEKAERAAKKDLTQIHAPRKARLVWINELGEETLTVAL